MKQLSNEEKAEAGYRGAYVYEYYREEETDRVRKRSNDFLTRNRLYRLDGIIDTGDKTNLRRLLLILKLDKKAPVVFNYTPADTREYEYIYFAMLYRGFSEIYFVDGYEVSDLTRYITDRAKEDLTSKILVGREEKLARGESIFTRCPYGYEFKQGKLRINEYEAFIVRYIYYRKSQGAGAKRIAGELRVRNFFNRQKKPITTDNVEMVLENYRIYQGYGRYLGKEYYGNHTHLIDDDKIPIGDMGRRLTKADLSLSKATREKLEKLERRYRDK